MPSVILCLALRLAGVPAEPASSTGIVALVEGKTVTHAAIVCGPLLRDDPARCHRAEQARLDRTIIQSWINAAAQLHHVSLTTQEKAQIEKRVALSHPSHIRTAKMWHALSFAVLRIRRGEDRAAVYDEVKREGLPTGLLDELLEMTPNLAAAERAAAKDYTVDLDREVHERESNRIVSAQLREIIQARATTVHQSFDEVADAFWAEIAEKTQTRIVDKNYQLPEPRRILAEEQ